MERTVRSLTRSAWTEAIEEESLIVIDEWCAWHGIATSIPAGIAMTQSVCDALERGVSLARIRGSQPVATGAIFARASAALARAAAEDPSPQGVIRFGVPLVLRAGGSSWSVLCLHRVNCESERLFWLSLNREGAPRSRCC